MKLRLLADSTISSYQNRLHLFLVNHTAVCVMLLTETFIQRSNHHCLLIGAMHCFFYIDEADLKLLASYLGTL